MRINVCTYAGKKNNNKKKKRQEKSMSTKMATEFSKNSSIDFGGETRTTS